MERELALNLGVNPSKIIFNGPYKQYNDIKDSLLSGSRIHVDSHSELDVIIQTIKGVKGVKELVNYIIVKD